MDSKLSQALWKIVIQLTFKKKFLNNNEILQKEKKYFGTMENYFDGSKTQRRKAEWKEQISKFQTIFFNQRKRVFDYEPH